MPHSRHLQHHGDPPFPPPTHNLLLRLWMNQEPVKCQREFARMCRSVVGNASLSKSSSRHMYDPFFVLLVLISFLQEVGIVNYRIEYKKQCYKVAKPVCRQKPCQYQVRQESVCPTCMEPNYLGIGCGTPTCQNPGVVMPQPPAGKP